MSLLERAFGILDFLMDIMWENVGSGVDGISEMLEKSMDFKVLDVVGVDFVGVE